jgi:hypothetical protein
MVVLNLHCTVLQPCMDATMVATIVSRNVGLTRSKSTEQTIRNVRVITPIKSGFIIVRNSAPEKADHI